MAATQQKTSKLPDDIPLFDSSGALSREYLLHRGHCCKNGCKNCPYGFVKPASSQSREES
jgi:hypothetical protein